MGQPRKPYKQTQLRTVFLRVPTQDWLQVTRGVKTEFRAARGHQTQAWAIKVPTPVVAYRVLRCEKHEAKLMVLEKTWREPLGAISEESLAREGYATFAEFRRYMRNRERRPFRPLQEVQVFQVRPWVEADRTDMASLLLDRLYGDFL